MHLFSAELTEMVLQVAVKLVPDTETFVDLLRGKNEDYETLKENMQILVSLLVPFLEDIHCLLVSVNFVFPCITSIGHANWISYHLLTL